MLGTTVMIPAFLVPLMGGTNGDKARVIQTLLFVAGINTLLQALFGTRLPAVVGGSYAYAISILYIINDSSLQQISEPHARFTQTMRAIQGALIVAASIQIILGLQPSLGSLFTLGNCVEIGIPMLLLVIGLSQYLKHVRPLRDLPIFERFPILICITIIWIYAVILTACGAYRNKPPMTQVHVPVPSAVGPTYFFSGTFLCHDVSGSRSTGAYMAASRLAIATPPPAYVLSRGIGWQGIGVLLDGLYGTCTGSTISVENVGLLGLTRVGSRRVVQISAGFMIFFSTLGSVGLSFLQFTNMNSIRNLTIIGLSFFLGISIPQFFNEYQTFHRGLVHTNAGWFNAFLNTIFSSPPTVGLIVAVFLDNTIEVEKSKKDRGMPWWLKFRTFRGDNRNEEFYTLPFNLNRFFPPT
ncbi:hypothetical protein HYC85_011938 [Camellia sinensis]|uniref:Uncharacterized protein n=1 Tax=Camellia sinensis TaxID=4442 RepID=A0A7J7HBE2_CAMSI|nr:hypothetical protein HYC85_011938 [Camellia sinensis]